MDTLKVHWESVKGVEVRSNSLKYSIDIYEPYSWKKVRTPNKKWWHFYALLPVAIIGYVLSEALVMALLLGAAYLGDTYFPMFMNQGGAILLGIAGAMGMIVAHYEYVWTVFDNMPDRSRFKITYE